MELNAYQRKCRVWACTILLCLMLCACATTEKEFPGPEQTIQWDQETPRSILDRLQKEQARIISLTASFSVLMDPPPQGQSSYLRGVIFFQKSAQGPRVRIKGLAPFGGTLFDMVARDDSVEIYIPARNTLYKGRREQTRPGNIWADTLQNMFPDFSRARVRENAVLAFKRHSVILPLAEGEIHLHMESGHVFKWISGGRITLYDNYENQLDLPPIPARISVERIDSPTKAVIRLDQITLNSDLRDVFDLSIYKARTVRNLSELKGP
jgi:hypothetical protein